MRGEDGKGGEKEEANDPEFLSCPSRKKQTESKQTPPDVYSVCVCVCTARKRTGDVYRRYFIIIVCRMRKKYAFFSGQADHVRGTYIIYTCIVRRRWRRRVHNHKLRAQQVFLNPPCRIFHTPLATRVVHPRETVYKTPRRLLHYIIRI